MKDLTPLPLVDLAKVLEIVKSKGHPVARLAGLIKTDRTHGLITPSDKRGAPVERQEALPVALSANPCP